MLSLIGAIPASCSHTISCKITLYATAVIGVAVVQEQRKALHDAAQIDSYLPGQL